MAHARFEWLLRLGDNALVLSHRLSQWCGHGPALEEDLALSNVALDLLGQARLWLALAGEVEQRGRDEDQLAYLRDSGEYRNLLLVEQHNGDFAMTMARQLYFDLWHERLLTALQDSRDPQVAAIAATSHKEVNYHVERSKRWVETLGDGTTESHDRMQSALEELWPYTGEMFEMDEVDEQLVRAGVGADLRSLRTVWEQQLHEVIDRATLRRPDPDAWMHSGGKSGVHSEHLGYLLAEMQFLQRAYPNANW